MASRDLQTAGYIKDFGKNIRAADVSNAQSEYTRLQDLYSRALKNSTRKTPLQQKVYQEDLKNLFDRIDMNKRIGWRQPPPFPPNENLPVPTSRPIVQPPQFPPSENLPISYGSNANLPATRYIKNITPENVGNSIGAGVNPYMAALALGSAVYPSETVDQDTENEQLQAYYNTLDTASQNTPPASVSDTIEEPSIDENEFEDMISKLNTPQPKPINAVSRKVQKRNSNLSPRVKMILERIRQDENENIESRVDEREMLRRALSQ